MSTFDEIRKERIAKYEKFKEAGLEPFPSGSARQLTLEEASRLFLKFAKTKKSYVIAGRLMAMRVHGGSLFFDLNDGSGNFQSFMGKDAVGEKSFSFFQETVDIGDFIECRGKFFLTKKKEKTLKVENWKMLAKSLRPLPEKWHGLQDIEDRFRKRYLDLLMNKEVNERFALRFRIITEIRDFLSKEGFCEVETPLLQPIAGGAIARPFKTHHNALDIDLYLRIAPELYLKRLLIGGFTKIFEIGRNFRNEGIDATHNPEFTMLELYEAYKDAKYLRSFIQTFFQFLVKKIFKKETLRYGGQEIHFKKNFAVISFSDVLKRHALITDPEGASREDLALKAKQFGIQVEDFENRVKILDNIFKKICRPKIVQPTFVINHPIQISPLAKGLPDNDQLVDRFQLIVAGFELVNGFSELNNPFEQKKRFASQSEERQKGDEEAFSYDEDFLEALEYGMPPAAGLGIGIDRLVMFLTNVQNIREVLLFPTMRPK